MFQTTVILILVYLLTRSICEDAALTSLLPRALQEYCPRRNVCPEKQETPVEDELNDPRFESCCGECSCGQNCSKNGDCCFANNITKQVDVDRFEKVKSCLYLTTKPPNENIRHYYQSYYMVSSINNLNQQTGEVVTNASCGDEKVAPWGSFYPVYSPKKNQIYKNIKCATNDGVSDGKLFEAIMSCKTLDFKSDVAHYMQRLVSTDFSDKCAIDFIVPEIENERTFKCFERVIKTCSNESDFEVPEGSNLTKVNIVKLCESGLLSPFRLKKLYANVFCYICNGEHFTKDDVCIRQNEVDSKFGTALSGKYGRLGFIGLIDQEFLKIGKTTNKRSGTQVCDTTRKCRQLLCASGKLRDQTGNCIYPNKSWMNSCFQIGINLTLNQNINITDVFKVPLGTVAQILPRIKSPWPNQWEIRMIHYGVDAGNYEMTSSLLVEIVADLYKVQPKRFLQNINKTITQNWVLEHNNNNVIMKAALTSVTFGKSAVNSNVSYAVFGNESKKVLNKEYKMVYLSKALINVNIFLTKLYLCEQVEIYQSEFILSEDQLVLFNFRTQRYMLDSEFILLTTRNEEKIRARICVEDSGMVLTFPNKSRVHDISDICFIIITLVILGNC